jgi:hypothetical protein
MSLKNQVTPPGIDPGTVRLVAQRLNHFATPDPKLSTVNDKSTELLNKPEKVTVAAIRYKITYAYGYF